MGYPIKEVDNHFYRSSRPTKEQLAQWKLIFNIGAILMLGGDNPDDAAIEREGKGFYEIGAYSYTWPLAGFGFGF